ncbi:hypothetical protein ACSBR1_013192 [Camellia fascicularis]
MVAWGYHVSDRIVIGGPVLVSATVIWFAGMVNYLLIGVAVGLLISAVSGALRNPDGLFLDEDGAISDGFDRCELELEFDSSKKGFLELVFFWY